MEIGIFAKTFKRNSYEEVIEAVRNHGFTTMQFNMSCAGLPSMPESIPEGLAKKINKCIQDSNLDLAALSGTFNMIHPDKQIREKGVQSFKLLIGNCRAMGTNVITICTGTRNPGDMWAGHPDNTKQDAWKDLCLTLENILRTAEEEKVIIAFEPELTNVVSSAKKGKQLLDEMKSDNLKVIFDPANLFEKANNKEIERILSEGLDLLGENIIIAHAKDRMADGSFAAAGTGILPYPFFIKELKKIGFDGELIAHSLEEKQAKECLNFLQSVLE